MSAGAITFEYDGYMSDPTPPRLRAIQRLIKKRDSDALVITYPLDVRWATGFSGDAAVLLVREKSANLITFAMFEGEAARVKAAKTHLVSVNPFTYAKQKGLIKKGNTVAYQSEY